MYWYALEPLADQRPAQALDSGLERKDSAVPGRSWSARSPAIGKPESIQLLIDAMTLRKATSKTLAILSGLLERAEGDGM